MTTKPSRTKDGVILLLVVALILSNFKTDTGINRSITSFRASNNNNVSSKNVTDFVGLERSSNRNASTNEATSLGNEEADASMTDSQNTITTETPFPADANTLYVIFCGGPRAAADMKAILDTWGKKVAAGLVMSNTPELLPLERIHNISKTQNAGGSNNLTTTNAAHWKVKVADTLGGGKYRHPKRYWSETFEIMYTQLQANPRIQWIVRSDSDTWWNVNRLHNKLMAADNPLLPHNESLAMGQFYPLLDFRWTRGVSNKPPDKKLWRSDGHDAYLSGGSGVVFTRTAVHNFYQCLFGENPTTLKAHSVEDIWLSNLAYECNVTLVRNDGMYQFNNKVSKKRGTKSIAIHHCAGNHSLKGYKHPSFYESALG